MSTIQFSPRLWAAAGVTAAATAASGPAVAAMVDATTSSTTASISVDFFDAAPGATPSSKEIPVTVSQFDPGLGTLTGISLSFNDFFEGGANATIPLSGCDFEGAEAGSCSYTLSGAFSATGVMSTPEGDGMASTQRQGSGSTSQPAGSPATDTILGVHNESGTTALGLPVGFGTNLLPYIGLGTWELLFQVDIDGLQASSQCSDGAFGAYCVDSAELSGTLDGGVTWEVNDIAVTYTYDPVGTVPEPSALALFSVALGALGAMGVRRRRKT